MNAVTARRTWLKHRCWLADIAAGLGVIVFLAAMFVLTHGWH